MKKIGIDFDNTIVCYDDVFYQAAAEKDLVPKDLPRHKSAVRDYLRSKNQENLWTELQGYIYGSRMDLASTFAGLHDFLTFCKKNNYTLNIISHKTLYPFMGPKYNLHESASNWLKKQPFFDLFDSIFFETTLDKKIERIHLLECDYFIDDLPELLTENKFSNKIKRILFDSSDCAKNDPCYTRLNSWKQIHEHFERNS
ncbi:MAG: haloacid dehalogenase-like hydrolase [Chlamydiae bacterium]|nr:haloacid dehalogenase-like hydrolase [Chlamydiota bacterium]